MRSIVIFWFYNDGQFIQVHKSGGGNGFMSHKNIVQRNKEIEL